MILVEQQAFDAEISVDDLFLVTIPDSRYELRKQLTSVALAEIFMCEDMVQQPPACVVFHNDANIFVCFNHVIKANDIRMPNELGGNE